MNILRKFLKYALMCICTLVIFAAPVHADSNIPTGDIGGEIGSWTTDTNLASFIKNAKDDLAAFQGNGANPLVKDYVPIEAKVGIAFIKALSWVSGVLDSSLVRFTIIFIILVYIFWIMFEAYQIIIAGKGTRDRIESIVRRGLVLAMWIIILNAGVAQVFMWIMGPILSLGTYLSDLILNSVTYISGASLPDTCRAIHTYVDTTISGDLLVDKNTIADIICVPTRFSGLFHTAVMAGWKWIIAGIGRSSFSIMIGIIFIYVFISSAFKFAFIAFGVIIDLFLALMTLPFTAIAETIKGTEYKGIAGQIFNKFLTLFNAESLKSQLLRFIRAVIYFISLSIVISLCGALLSGTITSDLSAQIPTIENNGFMVPLLTGCLVAYLAGQAPKLAEQIGGAITYNSGDELKRNAIKLKNILNNKIKTIMNKNGKS